jgi:hypothetical protein
VYIRDIYELRVFRDGDYSAVVKGHSVIPSSNIADTLTIIAVLVEQLETLRVHLDLERRSPYGM